MNTPRLSVEFVPNVRFGAAEDAEREGGRHATLFCMQEKAGRGERTLLGENPLGREGKKLSNRRAK